MDVDLHEDTDTDSDGLRKRSVHSNSNGSPLKIRNLVVSGEENESNVIHSNHPTEEDVNGVVAEDSQVDAETEGNETGTATPTPSPDDATDETKPQQQSSPCHSWISNGSSCTNLFEDDEECDGGEGAGGEDDYEYDPYTHEYVPRIREPPSGEDSDDGLLVSREQRDRSLSVIAQALLDSARVNQERYEHEQEVKRKRSSSGSAAGSGSQSRTNVNPDGDANNGNGASAGARRNSCFPRICGSKLCKIDEMPRYLQFNKHIHTGYREMQDFWGCVWSLSYLHNETLNILTHVAPIVYIVLYWKSMFPWGEVIGNTFMNCLGWSHIIASISPWIGSVIYHLFMSYNHQGVDGDRFYQLLLQIDMFGIWITECFGALSNLTAASWCLPNDYQTAIMTAYGLAAVYGLQKALTAWTPVARRMCFAPVFISRILAFILRISPWGGGNPETLHHVVLQDVLSIAGGIIGVVRIPEKWFPGRLDLMFNSHHIMHILVVIAVYHMNESTNGDIRWIINNYTQTQCIRL